MNESTSRTLDLDAIVAKTWRSIDPESSWLWASKNVDYSRAENYDTPYRGKFDPDLMPFWKQPLEDMQDRNCREVVILKCSRAGYSENLVLTDFRYTVARNPQPTMYVTGKMELAKGFMTRRVIRGMSLADETSRAMRRADHVAQEIQFANMDFRATWATSDTGTKQDGWERLYIDEFSLFDGFSVDAFRRRCSAYPFHHILFGSSLNYERRGNPEDDPALLIYKESTQSRWMMPDPKGDVFSWQMGDPSTPWGIKWPSSCKIDDKWDLDAVAESAYYITQAGARLEEPDRVDIMREGDWLARQESKRRGYMVVAPMIPFADCTFGELAKRFLSAKYRMQTTGSRKDRNRNTLRTYFAENWARAHRDEEESTDEDALEHCKEDYAQGKAFSIGGDWDVGNFVTGDMQKRHIWWLVRQWARNRKTEAVHSAMIDYGSAATLGDFDEVAGQFEPAQVGIDCRYRQSEVADYCAEYTDTNPRESRVMALMGSDTLKTAPLSVAVRDALEGRSTAGGFTPYLEIVWQSDYFRSWLIDLIKAGSTEWAIPTEWRTEKARGEYVKQVTSTRKVDGIWVCEGHGQDHLWDCECEQLVLARRDGLI